MTILVPYVEYNGSRTISDDMLKDVYYQMVDDGLIPAVFSNGSVGDPDKFIQVMKDPNNLPVFVFVDKEIVGFAWLNEIKDNHASVHFCFLKKIWGKVKPIGEKILDYWFSFPGEDGPLFDVLLGSTPDDNLKAVKFVETMGFTILGTIPNIYKNVFTNNISGAVVSYKQRE